MILDFFSRLGVEVSLYENCEHFFFPDDFLMLALAALTGYFLSTALQTKEKTMKERIVEWFRDKKEAAEWWIAGNLGKSLAVTFWIGFMAGAILAAVTI